MPDKGSGSRSGGKKQTSDKNKKVKSGPALASDKDKASNPTSGAGKKK
jgi:hypothetical protein